MSEQDSSWWRKPTIEEAEELTTTLTIIKWYGGDELLDEVMACLERGEITAEEIHAIEQRVRDELDRQYQDRYHDLVQDLLHRRDYATIERMVCDKQSGLSIAELVMNYEQPNKSEGEK